MTIDVHDQAAYDALQAKLIPLWRSIERLNTDRQTIVVVPSAEVDFELTPAQLQAYEERYLFLLFLLRQPRARMVYVTGQPINPDIVDYYLDVMPGVIASHARRRLVLVSPDEASTRPLAEKLLDQSESLAAIRDAIDDPDRAHLVPFMASWKDRELAMRLGIPMYGADPKDAHLGTKSSGRKLFAEAGVPHPAGREDLHTIDELVSAIQDMRADDPSVNRVVVKHNEGVSGYGNVTVDVSDAPDGPAIRTRLDNVDIEMPGATREQYFEILDAEGGIVEAMFTAEESRSPSVQLRITPLGTVELLSTHDQILGGDSGQVFIGSRFPADQGYGPQIGEYALAVGERLAAKGVIGRFAIDFVVGRNAGAEWDAQAIELNLRKGGTTHPFLTLQFLTDGHFDDKKGQFFTPQGSNRFYVASDHLNIGRADGMTPRELIDLALIEELHFDQATQVGTVFHMLSALTALGQVGLTSVGSSPQDAQQRFDRVVQVFGGSA
ncbi:MAG: hypothetical protein HKN91_01210 [Acidimicrobiia bacterium]|nr:hypothetical protein [Acidimicrobiia bacterium]